MKTIAIIDADFERSPLGTRSRLTDLLAGEPVVRRTARRTLESAGLASVHLVVPVAQAAVARDALSGLDVRVETHDSSGPMWHRYVASSRKWSLDSWRGGISGTTMFDESLNPWVAEALARREGADAVAIVPAAAAILDPELLGRMIDHYHKVREDVRLTFTQSPPGLSACIYSTALLADLAAAGQFVGRIMAYRPTHPQREMNIQPCFYPVENVIAHAAGRCLVDTEAGAARVAEILRVCGESVTTLAASRWCGEHRFVAADLPEEVEVELTTQDPLACTTLRPRGRDVPSRGPLTGELFERLVAALSQRDDARLVLGGFGDPLLHPEWGRFVARAREAGVLGIAIRTPAVHLDAAAIEQIIASRVDLVNVLLDAHTAEAYAAVHGADYYERVIQQIESLIEQSRRAENGAVPLIVCEMIKTRRTMAEMEAFYDHWLNKGCGAVVVGPSHFGGRRPDQSVMNIAPPTRFPCLRPFRRCIVLADGSVTLCDEDYDASHAVGHLSRATLAEVWRGQTMGNIRSQHVERRWDALPLCGPCNEWHRA